MSEVSIYKGTPTNFEEAHALAKIFADSGMFDGAKGLAQAMVKVQAGAELGITPYAAMSGIHIISGKPVLGAGLIAAKIRQSGRYDYEMTKSSDTVCELKIVEIRSGNRVPIGTEAFTIEQARKAGVKNLDKFPKNMLFARCISNAAKFYCPDIFNGAVYVPEDFDTVETKDVPHSVVETKSAQPATVQESTSSSETAQPEPGTAILKPSGKQLATLRNLLSNAVFSDDERQQWEVLIAKPTTDGPKVDGWIKKVTEEFKKRSKEAKSKPVEAVAPSQSPDAVAFENAGSETAPHPLEPVSDDDLPDFLK
jgi:hypothetical protein